jgi:DNA-binding CsgD family transcriptional regulator
VREKEVIALLAHGLTLAQAADALGITYRAARWRTDRARDRINAKTTPELVRWAIDHGCVPRPTSSGRIPLDQGPA